MIPTSPTSPTATRHGARSSASTSEGVSGRVRGGEFLETTMPTTCHRLIPRTISRRPIFRAYVNFGGICREYDVPASNRRIAERIARRLLAYELRITTAQASFASVTF